MSERTVEKLRSWLVAACRFSIRAGVVCAAVWALALLSIFCMKDAGHLPYVVLPGLGLAVLVQWPRVTVGWIVGATFALALAGAASTPMISYPSLRLFWQAESAFAGAAAGAFVGTACVLAATHFRFDLRILLELTVACSLVMAFQQAYSEASVRNDRWIRGIETRMLSADDLTRSLETAFQNASQKQLSRFFDDWQLALPPKPNREVSDPLRRDVYELYTAFLDPPAVERLGSRRFGESADETPRYLVLQNSIDFYVGGLSPSRRRTIEDFRPQLRSGGVDTVFLTSRYERGIESFLDTGALENRTARQEFLGSKIAAFPGRWGGWELLTAPSVLQIVFNRQRTEAAVYFRRTEDRGVALMTRQGGGWKRADSVQTATGSMP